MRNRPVNGANKTVGCSQNQTRGPVTDQEWKRNRSVTIGAANLDRSLRCCRASVLCLGVPVELANYHRQSVSWPFPLFEFFPSLTALATHTTPRRCRPGRRKRCTWRRSTCRPALRCCEHLQ